MIDMTLIRSLLFVPGSRPDRFNKALRSGADAIVIDLEDAVPSSCKDRAREEVTQFVGSSPTANGSVPIFVRPNSLSCREGLRDLDRLLDGADHLAGILLPKADASSMQVLSDITGPVREDFVLGALIETARGLSDCEAVATIQGVGFLMFGAADLSAELRCTMDWEAMLHARSRMISAAATTGIAAIDTPAIDIQDVEHYASELRRSFALGFTGRAAIHPKMVDAIHEAIVPSPDTLEADRRLISAFEEAGKGAVLLDGRLVERPLLAAALRRKALAHRKNHLN